MLSYRLLHLQTTSCEGPIIVLCVQRVNAVWHVQHILKSFTGTQMLKSQLYCKWVPSFRNNDYANVMYMYMYALTGSSGFDSAITDIKKYFSTGLFCQPSALITEYEVS